MEIDILEMILAIVGIGSFKGIPVTIIGIQKGKNTKEKHNEKLWNA